jgi:hypothetical protein
MIYVILAILYIGFALGRRKAGATTGSALVEILQHPA